MKSIDQVDIKSKRVLIRVDFNVPVDDKGVITDDTRIKAHIRTISYCLDNNAKVILTWGDPKGKGLINSPSGPLRACFQNFSRRKCSLSMIVSVR